jgi:hypothetical protein
VSFDWAAATAVATTTIGKEEDTGSNGNTDAHPAGDAVGVRGEPRRRPERVIVEQLLQQQRRRDAAAFCLFVDDVDV